MIKEYRTKPVTIYAVQFNGTYESALMLSKWSVGKIKFDISSITPTGMVKELHIETLEGLMTAKVDDYIIRGLLGEFYPCKLEVFNKKYEEVMERP